ncbi:hypothetical protein BJY01DRAFT_136766 [Aspergillus pseudoustus]|uniref:LysM domain-containing protein n=1 Tax=Aspergillus pseudoustus TaxID=1810923 RepID=A0ABR4KY73_9EURO
MLLTLVINLIVCGLFVPLSSAQAQCASNITYTVVAGDDCGSIARAHGVPMASLISANELRPDCANLWSGQVLCVPPSCQLFPVNMGSTCQAICDINRISIGQLYEWNPYLNSECTNLIAGDEVCISRPGTGVRPTTTTTIFVTATTARTSGYATATVSPPGQTPRGTTRRCGAYYQVRSGDYCELIADSFSIDLPLFQAINPSINSDCTNLVPGLYYCVSPTRDWNETTTTTAVPTYTAAPAPTPSGTTSHCYEWYVVRSGDSCNRIESLYGITLDEFRLWNPSLNQQCSNLRAGIAYCIHGERGQTPSPPVVPAQPTTLEPRGSDTIIVESRNTDKRG